jgi:hypothetical protein
MLFFDSFYYWCYKYSVKILKDTEPYATTNFLMSFSELLVVAGVLSLITAKFFCIVFTDRWILITLFFIILTLNYFLYQRSGRGRTVVPNKPLLFKSKIVTSIIIISFEVFGFSWLVWGGPVIRIFLDQCN